MYTRKRKGLIYSIAFICVAAIGIVLFYTVSLPDEITLFDDEVKLVDYKFPFNISGDEAISVMSSEDDGFINRSVKIYSHDMVDGKLYFTILDKIKIKEVSVSVQERKSVIPGGQSIGVKMNVAGVIVVGMEEIPIGKDKNVNPCLNSGLQIGDNIIEINGNKIKSAVQVQNIVNSANEGEAVSIIAKRNGKKISCSVVPVFSLDEKTYRLGLWVRDKTAGIGTLTFYDEDEEVYGALGHGIADPDTGVLLDAADGEALYSKVLSVKQGTSGDPGEIRGIFYESEHPLGTIILNSDYGIFGNASEEMKKAANENPVEIGYQNEVKKGKAVIRTTVDDGGVKEYEIEIEKINQQISPSTKSMVIKVTDKELLEKCGGIVQGMSGSPILQNGRIIGAITHVFVNNPKKGYAVFIEWMLSESDKTDNLVESKSTNFEIKNWKLK